MSNIEWAVNRMLEGSAVESVAENAERDRIGANRVAYALRKLTNPEPGVRSLSPHYDGHYLVRITFTDKRVLEYSEPFFPAELLFLDDWQEVPTSDLRPPTPNRRKSKIEGQ